jgi:aerobic carbon-monoxide dehydrogenase small subunit
MSEASTGGESRSETSEGYSAAGRGEGTAVPGQPLFAEESETYSLEVNGRERSVPSAWLGESLLYVLRERLGLPGSKNACEQGECGSCSVFVDGALVCACCMLAADAVESPIVTVEGVAGAGPEEALSDVQAGFRDAGAVQCGFCTPGLVVAVHDLLDRNPDPSELEVREAISGNLCRCTGYGRIFAAVDAVREARARG